MNDVEVIVWKTNDSMPPGSARWRIMGTESTPWWPKYHISKMMIIKHYHSLREIMETYGTEDHQAAYMAQYGQRLTFRIVDDPDMYVDTPDDWAIALLKY
jgi:hypothetical protein